MHLQLSVLAIACVFAACSSGGVDMGTEIDLAGADLAGEPPADLAGLPPADLAGSNPDLAMSSGCGMPTCCVPGTSSSCGGGNETWTGTQCCVTGSPTCIDGNASSCAVG